MERLPSLEEREWLARSLKELLFQRRALLDSAPLVEPTNDWFPEPWSMTAAHGHRLAQRLMHYAGLRGLRISLDAYEPEWTSDEEQPWDAGTAGWFAGIADGRAHFGLHVNQFDDPEKAAGVLAHEVAHAWREHHRLVVDDRDEEEHLTDLTTIVLGFGILTTNITDRYRSSGTWDTTAWSISSAGYLPPQAMAYALALWTTARGDERERKAIERHLEPNQLASFRAALEDIGETRELRAAGTVPAQVARVTPEEFAPVEPRFDEISEPDAEEDKAPNRGRMVYRRARGDTGLLAVFGTLPGIVFGSIVAMIVFGQTSGPKAWWLIGACGAITSILAIRHSRRSVCSECNTPAPNEVAICADCGGTLSRRVTARELRRIREEELDRRAARDVDYEECDACEPERPCPAHQATVRFVAPVGEQVAIEPEASPEAPSPRWSKRFTMAVVVIAVAIAGVAGAIGWRRQNRVRVFFDNALRRNLTLKLNGESIALRERPVLRELAPGRHRVTILEGDRELERFDANVTRQPFLGALVAPHFFVYSVAGAGIYRRAEYVYARNAADQHATEELIALQRWIEQRDADFVFADAPALRFGGQKATRTGFNIAGDRTWSDVAYAWHADGKADDAYRALHKGIELAPCDDRTHGDLITFLEITDQHERAVTEAAQWVAQCDQSIAAHRVHQDYRRTDGETESLLARYRQRLDRAPTAANHYLYGRLLRGPEAIAQQREALRLDPALTWPRVALGHDLLAAEEDAEAYATFEDALRARDAIPGTAAYFARAAVARGNEDDALTFLGTLDHLDPRSLYEARWVLHRSKRDWNAAKVALATFEAGERTPETIALRAAIEWEEGGPRQSILADLRKRKETTDGANELAFQDALEHGRLEELTSLEPSLRWHGRTTVFSVHAVAASILARSPDARAKADALRNETRDPVLLALLDLLEGRPESDVLIDADIAPHVWFMRAVHASSKGDRAEASRLFVRAAERALDRGFPYRLALQHAAAHE